ncbi:MAG: DUF4870 domain-containing protein [Acidobacteriota bacterium]|nr:MAG: DUF4870 domain-containing protein [Acidobacteriota bacterium]
MLENQQGSGPTPPPQTPPQTPPTGAPPPASNASPNRTIMLVLSYLGILALIPLLVEKDDQEVQWHAKHGLILMVTWIVLSIVLMVLSGLPVIGPILGCAVGPIIWLAILAIHIICIVKAVGGDRFKLPVISDFADQWK